MYSVPEKNKENIKSLALKEAFLLFLTFGVWAHGSVG
jgi:hypothetical protein